MICIGKFTKGHNSVQSVNGATVLVLCTLSDYFFYISAKFCARISNDFRVTDPDSRIDARVVAICNGT